MRPTQDVAWTKSRMWLGVAVLAVAGGCSDTARWSQVSDGRAGATPILSRKLEALLKQKLRLVEELGADPQIVHAVRRAGRQNALLRDVEIRQFEKRWGSARMQDDFIKSFLMNPCAERLYAFQDQYPSFPEIFVTDARGLVVAQTNKTSDYVQSDESWWQAAYAGGWGWSSFGELEYDESAFSESISFNVPVLDPKTGKSIGVLKAVCDITDLKMDL